MDDVDTEPITRAIRCFTVSLGRENDLEREKDPEIAATIILIGSGTLISWKGNVGIMTASHVIEEGMLRDTATLHLGGDALGEVWQFEREHLKIHTIGKYSEAAEETGPDLAVIELPLQGSTMHALKAKKSFYNLEKNFDPRIAEAQDEKGLVALAGTLGETRKELGVANGLDQVRHDGFVGYSPFRRYFEGGEFDYVDVTVQHDPATLPQKYGGMSGGGLWKIPVLSEPSGKIFTRDPVLAGVNFYQFFPDETKRGTIRCHGVRSVYKVLSSV